MLLTQADTRGRDVARFEHAERGAGTGGFSPWEPGQPKSQRLRNSRVLTTFWRGQKLVERTSSGRVSALMKHGHDVMFSPRTVQADMCRKHDILSRSKQRPKDTFWPRFGRSLDDRCLHESFGLCLHQGKISHSRPLFAWRVGGENMT